MSRTALGYTYAAIGAVLWATTGLFYKVLIALGLPGTHIVTLRVSLAALLIGAAALARDRTLLRIQARDVPLFIAQGILGVCAFYYLYFLAVYYTTVSTAVIFLHTAPLYVMVISALIFRERVTAVKIVAIAVALGGVALLMTSGGGRLAVNPLGTACGLGAGFLYALLNTFGRAGLERYRPWTVVLYSLGFGGAFYLLWTAPTLYRTLRALTGAGWLVLAGLVLVPTVTAYMFYFSSLTMIEVSRASLVATLEPFAGALLGCLALGERLTSWQLAGGALTIAAVLMVQAGSRRKPASRTAGKHMD